MEAKDRIILASDIPNLRKVSTLVKELHPFVGFFEVGIEMISNGIALRATEIIKRAGGKVFYDAKIKDIPKYAAGAVKSVVKLGVDIITVDCFGGPEMLKAIVIASKEEAKLRKIQPPSILSIPPVLTSMDYEDLVKMGIASKLDITDSQELKSAQEDFIKQLTQSFALLSEESGLDGVVVSPREIKIIKECCGSKFLVFATGVRPTWAFIGNHKRSATPYEAFQNRADKIIIGDPIIHPPPEIGSSIEAARKIIEEIEEALKGR